MTVFSDAASWLHDNRLAHATISVVYGRGVDSYPILAWLGRTIYEDLDDQGLVVRNETRDYFMDITEYEALGLDFPQVSDTVTEIQGGETYIYKVTSIPGRQHYERDTHRLRYRVHTKRISAE